MRNTYLNAILREVRAGWQTDALVAALARVPDRCVSESVVTPYLTLRALWYANPNQVRCVILGGQAPYPSRQLAAGLAFAQSSAESPLGRPAKTRALAAIAAEVKRSTGQLVDDLSLVPWARQGVLLLNRSLSTKDGRADSDRGAWNEVTEIVLKLVETQADKPTWLVWGQDAYRQYEALKVQPWTMDMAAHPANTRLVPNPFYGCDHFKLAGQLHNIKWGI